MLKTILVPLDRSPLARRALPYAEAVARASGAKLIVLHIPSNDESSAEAEAEIEATAAEARQSGIQVESWVYQISESEAETWWAIAEAAQQAPADLLVMSTHGRGGPGRWIYGSVADQVMRHVEMPVLLISANCTRTWLADRAARILVPLDGSPLAEEAISPATDLAGALGADLILLETVAPSIYEAAVGAPPLPLLAEADLAKGRNYLNSLAVRLQAAGRPAFVETSIGDPATQIAAVARDRDVDAIAMATHGRSGLARLVLGSVAMGTLQRVQVPILLVRPRSGRVERRTRPE